MVDVAQISRILKRHFDVTHMVHWDLDDQGRVQVWGHIRLVGGALNDGQIPLQFGRVSGDFIARACELNSLAGAPDHVGRDFDVRMNNLTMLTLGPRHVAGSYMLIDNPLTSLAGLSDHVGEGLYLSYDENLPLLRLVQQRAVYWDTQYAPPMALKKIINDYMGKGKTHMLNLALELKQAGYGSNAKW
jgi:hypothetical protein